VRPAAAASDLTRGNFLSRYLLWVGPDHTIYTKF
jgi:hypothetical protein